MIRIELIGAGDGGLGDSRRIEGCATAREEERIREAIVGTWRESAERRVGGV
jgi:hypothetical protein